MKSIVKKKSKPLPIFTASVFISILDIEKIGLKRLLKPGVEIYANHGGLRGTYHKLIRPMPIPIPGINTHDYHTYKSAFGKVEIASRLIDGIFLEKKFTKKDIEKALRIK